MKKLGNVERKGVRNGGLKAAAAILLSVVMIAASVSLFSGSGNDGHEYDDRALGAAGDVQFKNMFGGQNSDSFSGSTATPDGGVVAVGYSFGSSFDGAGDWPDVAHATNAVIATIVKYDFMGNLEWNTSFPESAQSITTAQYRFTGVTAVTDGYVAVGNADTFISGDWDAGVTGKGSVDAIIVKFDLNGELQWAKNFGGNATDGFEGVTAMPDGGVIAVGFSGFASFNTGNWTGYYNYGTSNDDAIAVKFDAYGEVEWKDHFGGEGQDRFSDVVSIGNDFIVAGYSSVSSFGNNDWDSVTGRGGNDAIIVRYVYDSGTYDCETGWKVRFGGTGNDEFNALTVLSTGKIVAVGQSDNASFGTGDWTGVAAWTGASDATIAEFDADDGTPGWKDKFGGSAASNAYDYFNGVTAVYDGGFVAVGLSGAGSFPTGDWAGIGGKGNEDAIAVKYTAAGTVEWKKNFGGSESERFSDAAAVSSGVFAIGSSPAASFNNNDWSGITGKGGQDAIIVKYEIGALTFEDDSAFDIPASDQGTAITEISVYEAVFGGKAPYTFSATGLPSGIVIDSVTGVISGTPTAAAPAGSATVTVTDSSASSKDITISYGAVTGVITEVEITGLTEPVIGIAPTDAGVSVPSGADYGFVGPLIPGWGVWDGTAYVSFPGNFEAGKTYRFGLILMPGAGYKFSSGVTATINGEAAGTETSGVTIMVYLEFTLTDTTPPTVTDVTPAGTASISGNVVIMFSEAMDSAVTGTVQLNSLTALSGGSWSAGDTVYTIGYSGLGNDTAYTVNISGFKDVAGNTMVADGTNSFTTKKMAFETVEHDVFIDGSTAISGNTVDLASLIPTDTGAVVYTVVANQGAFPGAIPDSGISISAGILTYDTNVVAGPVTYGINIGLMMDNYENSTVQIWVNFIDTSDTTAPTVTAVLPNGTDAEISGVVVITFSEVMSTTPGTVQLNSLTALTGGSWSSGNTVFTIAYDGLSYSTSYTVNISGFKDVSGNTMTADGTNSFTTVDVVNASLPDITTQPTDLVVMLNESAEFIVVASSPDTSEGGYLTYQWYSNTSLSNTGGSPIGGGTYPNQGVPSSVAGTFYYYCVVTNYITDNGDGGIKSVPLATNAVKLVVNPIDNDPPTVAGVTPSGTGAAISGSVVITFSEAMDPAVAGTVQLNSLTALTGGSWSSGDTVFTIAYSGLSYGTSYTVNISGFEDVAGNAMTADSGNSFTTAAPTYAVTVNGGTGGGSFAAGVTVTITADPAPAGKEFDAWVVDSANVTLDDENDTTTTFTMPAEAVEVTATYKDILYTVTVNDGTGDGSFAAGVTVTITADPAPAGKEFDKWVVDSANVTLDDENDTTTTFTMPAEAVEVTATYKDILYTVTVNDGTGDGSFAAGVTVSITADAAPAGKEFDKWVVDSANVTLDDENDTTTTFTMPAEAVEVTATYKDTPVPTYAVTVNGGTGDGSFAAGATVSITADAAPAGKEFDEWVIVNGTVTFADANSASTTFTMPAEAVEVTAAYKDILYTVTVNDGTGGGSFAAGATVSITADPAPAGKVFDKWTAVGVTLANPNDESTTFTMPVNAVTVTATYKNVYAVTYDITEGDGTVPTESDKSEGDTFTAASSSGIDAPTGKQFKEWNTLADGTGTAYAEGATVTMPDDDIVLYAIWMDIPLVTYSVTYDLNGGSGTVPAESDKGEGATFAAASSSGITAPTGKQFKEWNTLPDGSGASYATGATVTMPDDDLVLYAVWEDIPLVPHSVTYNANGGSGTVPTETVKTKGSSFAAASASALTAPAGKVFKEWNTSSDGSGTPYAAGASVTMPDNALVLYAIWDDAASPPADGGSDGSDTTMLIVAAVAVALAAVVGVVYFLFIRKP